MEALILTCSTGGGHNAAAKAIAEALTDRGHNAKILDPFTLIGERAAKTVGGTYVRMVQISPSLFGVVYQLGEGYRRLPFKSPVYVLNGRMWKRLLSYFNEHHVDAVFCTHVFPAEMLTYMKNNGMKVPKVFFIATDYTCVPFTEETDCDWYCIPSIELADEYIRRGVPSERLYPSGIPVMKAFSDGSSAIDARKLLGLDPDREYILLSGGSVGAGKLRTAIRVLEPYLRSEDARLIVLCGNNDGLYTRLNNSYLENQYIEILRSTDQMPAYIRACDVFITKPGGLSSTESAAARAATVFISPIPGCETHNCRFFVRRGMALTVTNIRRKLLPAIQKLYSETASVKMSRRQEMYVPGDASDKIVDLFEETFKYARQPNAIEYK